MVSPCQDIGVIVRSFVIGAHSTARPRLRLLSIPSPRAILRIIIRIFIITMNKTMMQWSDKGLANFWSSSCKGVFEANIEFLPTLNFPDSWQCGDVESSRAYPTTVEIVHP